MLTAHGLHTMASIYRISSGWRAQVRLKGMTPVSQVFPTQRAAKDWAREQEGKNNQSTDLTGGNLNISTIIKTYRDTIHKIASSKDTSLRVLEYYLGAHKVSTLTTRHIVEFAQKRRTERFHGRKQGRPGLPGPATVLQDLVYLKTLLHHGGAIMDSTAAIQASLTVGRAIKTLRHASIVRDSTRRERRPTEEELHKIEEWLAARPRAASSIPTFELVLFAICTCMRLGEIVGSGGVMVEDFNLANRTLIIRNRKDPSTDQGRDDCIPLLSGHITYRGKSIDPVEIIMRQRTLAWGRGKIFPYSAAAVGLNFSNATEACQINDLTFHDLRHDGISRMFEAGYDIPQVAAVSGHKSWKNLQRYTHIKPSQIQKNNPITFR
jgi:integrase